MKKIVVRILVMRIENYEKEVLLVLEKEQIKGRVGEKFTKPAGWGLPGGRHEGNNPLETAIQKIEKETGLKAGLKADNSIDILIEDKYIEIPTPKGTTYLYNGLYNSSTIDIKEFKAPIDKNIVTTKWVRIDNLGDRAITIEHNGSKFPVYNSHLSMIQDNFCYHPINY